MSIINNNKTDPNKILPMTYYWAREHYKAGVSNNWSPEEIPMQNDIAQWKSNFLSKEERNIILLNLGFFSTAESLTANNIVLAIYRHITNPECRQYLLRQAFEEAIHTDFFIYCCDSLSLDPEEIYGMYKNISFIKEKDDFVLKLTENILDPDFSTKTKENIQKFIYDLIGFYVIMEGIYFYAGFSMMLSLKRKNIMVGIGEQFEYIMRDESLHISFGYNLINTIIKENQYIWTKELRHSINNLIIESVELEKKYAMKVCPNGVVGINSREFIEYVEYIADRRLKNINLPILYHRKNPFQWMSQSTDLSKEKNFFEKKVTDYKNGGILKWD